MEHKIYESRAFDDEVHQIIYCREYQCLIACAKKSSKTKIKVFNFDLSLEIRTIKIPDKVLKIFTHGQLLFFCAKKHIIAWHMKDFRRKLMISHDEINSKRWGMYKEKYLFCIEKKEGVIWWFDLSKKDIQGFKFYTVDKKEGIFWFHYSDSRNRVPIPYTSENAKGTIWDDEVDIDELEDNICSVRKGFTFEPFKDESSRKCDESYRVDADNWLGDIKLFYSNNDSINFHQDRNKAVTKEYSQIWSEMSEKH